MKLAKGQDKVAPYQDAVGFVPSTNKSYEKGSRQKHWSDYDAREIWAKYYTNLGKNVFDYRSGNHWSKFSSH